MGLMNSFCSSASYSYTEVECILYPTFLGVFLCIVAIVGFYLSQRISVPLSITKVRSLFYALPYVIILLLLLSGIPIILVLYVSFRSLDLPNFLFFTYFLQFIAFAIFAFIYQLYVVDAIRDRFIKPIRIALSLRWVCRLSFLSLVSLIPRAYGSINHLISQDFAFMDIVDLVYILLGLLLTFSSVVLYKRITRQIKQLVNLRRQGVQQQYIHVVDFQNRLDNTPREIVTEDYQRLTDSDSFLDLGAENEDNTIPFFSELFFYFVNPLIKLAAKQGQLQPSDIPELSPSDNTEKIESRFETIWNEEMKLMETNDIDSTRRPSLLRAFWRLCGWPYLLLGAFKFTADALGFVGPIVLSSLINFIDDRVNEGDTSQNAGYGYLYASLLTLGVILSSFFSTHYSYRAQRISLRVRTAILTAVYSKALSVSISNKMKFSSGMVTNLMAVDSERMMNICISFHELWSLPIQIGIALYLLYLQVQLALIAGVVIIVLLIPINGVLTSKIAGISRNMMTCKDERVLWTDDLIQNIRTIKFMAWEPIYYDNLRIIRHKEVHQLKKRKYLDALCVYFWATTPILVSLATFGMYTLLGHQLTAAKAFTSLSLFNILIRPLNAYPWVINGLVEGHVSATRVYSFLTSEDVQVNPLSKNEDITTKHPAPLAFEIRGDFVFSKADQGLVNQLNSPEVGIPTRKPVINTPRLSEWLRLDQEFASPSIPQLTASQSIPGNAEVSKPGRASVTMNLLPLGNEISDSEKFDASMMIGTTADAQLPFHLHSLSLQVKKGEFIGISGSVGQGKSSLLLAILGELWACNPVKTERGSNIHSLPRSFSSIHGSVAYVAQEAWIQNATIRENVCFGHEFHSVRYWEVLHACALLDDLKQFPARDLTEVGEGGHSISGGQKIRLSLARAIYAGTDILLLDDPLSAVDVHVAHHIVKHALLGLLATKTRILVTHHAHAIRTADRILHMSKGCISHASSGNKKILESEDNDTPIPKTTIIEEISDKTDMAPPTNIAVDNLPVEPEASDERTNYVFDEIAKGRLTIEESRSRGTIRRRVLHSYFSFIGLPLAGLILLSLVSMQGTRNFNDWWVADWADDITDPSPSTNVQASSDYHLKILAIVAAINSFCALFRAFIFAYGGLVAARRIYDRLLWCVLYAPVLFFDENPAGRILNRFSSDTYAIDESIPFQGNIFLAQLFLLLGSVTMLTVTTPIFLLLLPPLSYGYIRLQRRYRYASRELRRLDSITRSPLYASFSETLSGVVTIRAFGRASSFRQQFSSLLDLNQRIFFYSISASQWLALRLQAIGILVVTFLSFFSVILAIYLNPSSHSVLLNTSLVGLALAYAFPLTDTLQALIGSGTDTEKELISVERTVEYLDLQPEETVLYNSEHPHNHVCHHTAGLYFNPSLSYETEGCKACRRRNTHYLDDKLPLSWPANGSVTFENVTFAYRQELAPALNGISFTIPAGAHVGIVGTTGAGKSSLLHALFRLRPLRSGRILVDGVDLANLSLSRFRSRIAMIPQMPTLMRGSIRTNLDPWNEFDDSTLWEALKKCLLDEKIRSLGGLHVDISKASVLSVGERQLLCMSRVFLSSSPLLVLDEANSSMDFSTDATLQRLLAKHKSTVLLIAHRLSSILHCDLVMVVNNGQVVEFDAPSKLLLLKDSRFYALVNQSDYADQFKNLNPNPNSANVAT